MGRLRREFGSDALNDTHIATVQHDEDQGRNLALPGTPSFLVNGQRVFNASPDALRAAIEQALAS